MENLFKMIKPDEYEISYNYIMILVLLNIFSCVSFIVFIYFYNDEEKLHQPPSKVI